MGGVNSDTVIEVLEAVDDEVVAAFARLIPLLSTNAPIPDRDRVERVFAQPGNTVFAARAAATQQRILGLLTLVRIELATGTEARIEDVVVDDAARGLGRALVVAALKAAVAQGANRVDLTSAPRRVAARRLYQSLGFEQRETGVFRHRLDEYR